MGLELGVCGGLELGPIGSITPANAAIPEKKKYDESPDGEETVGPSVSNLFSWDEYRVHCFCITSILQSFFKRWKVAKCRFLMGW